MENVKEGEKGLDMEFGIVPSELIASSEDESETDSEMDEDEKRIFDLINLKVFINSCIQYAAFPRSYDFI